jgi:6-hydroxynicotinate 3-monooxygenase
VIGAGLGGLAAAGFLQRAGFQVTLYEQADEFSRVGAGIILSANVAKVLRRLGLEEELVATGIKPDAYISRAWDTGDLMYRIDLDGESERRYGGPYLNIHRGDLHDVLKHAVEPGGIAMGHQLAGLEERGDALRLRFTNGVSTDADVVIGADGIRSKVRDYLLGSKPPRYIGKVAQRAIFAAERLGVASIPDCTKWWGEDSHILAYYMTPRRDEVYLIGVVSQPTWESEAPFRSCSKEEFRASYEGWHPDLLRVVDAADDVTVWPIFDRERDDRWTGGRIALLGDACHPMRPFMAAGGAMAIEDAAILSRCLTTFDDPGDAFRSYEATRIDRVGAVQRISIENSWMRGPTDTDWFYGYDACTAPLASRGLAV